MLSHEARPTDDASVALGPQKVALLEESAIAQLYVPQPDGVDDGVAQGVHQQQRVEVAVQAQKCPEVSPHVLRVQVGLDGQNDLE